MKATHPDDAGFPAFAAASAKSDLHALMVQIFRSVACHSPLLIGLRRTEKRLSVSRRRKPGETTPCLCREDNPAGHPHLSAGGAERTTIEVAEALKAAGAKALVASVGGRLEGELSRAGAELIRIDRLATKSPFGIYGNASILAKIIAKHKVDLVHARSRAPAWSALWAARRMKKPFVTTYHGVYNAKSAPKKLYNSVMARGDLVIANSEFTAAHVRKEYPEAASQIVTIPRGVDIGKFSPDAILPARKAVLAKAWRLPAEGADAVILLPARMTGWKGHREAIAAAAQLMTAKDLPWRMIFAGDDQGRAGYLQELAHLITQHGLDDRIAIVGHCDDMPAAFALSDIVIAPSNEPEAFGRVAARLGLWACRSSAPASGRRARSSWTERLVSWFRR